MDQKQWIAEMMAMWPTVEPTAKGRPEPFLAKLYSLSPAVATDVIEQVFYGEKQFDGSPRAYVLSAVKQRLRAKVEAEEKGEPLDDYDAMRAGLRALDIDQESRRVAALHTTELRGKPEAENE